MQTAQVHAGGTSHVHAGGVQHAVRELGGRWAGEQYLAQLSRGEPMSPEALRSCDTLSHEAWIHFDDEIGREGIIRLRAVADLIERGLTDPVPNAMGQPLIQFQKISDMEPAQVSLDATARTESHRITVEQGFLPLPIIHSDWDVGIRELAASRDSDIPLESTQAGLAGRRVAERMEDLLINGGPTFEGNAIFGYLTHPDRNTAGFGVNGNWSQAAKTGDNILTDVLTMKQGSIDDRFYGPWGLYVPTAYDTVLDGEFSDQYPRTIRSRLLEVEGLESIRVVDQLPDDNIAFVQLTSDVVKIKDGEPMQTVQWDVLPGAVTFRAMAIQVPLIRSTKANRSGVFHMS